MTLNKGLTLTVKTSLDLCPPYDNGELHRLILKDEVLAQDLGMLAMFMNDDRNANFC